MTTATRKQITTTETATRFVDDAEIFRWGPVPLRYFYMSEFMYALRADFHESYPDHRWPHTALLLHEDGRGLWLNDKAELYATGAAIFKQYMLEPEKRADVYSAWERERDALVQFHAELDQLIAADGLSQMNADEFLALWKRFYNAVIAFWVPVIVPELANYGSTDVLEEAIEEVGLTADQRTELLEVLTAPEVLSFYQEEEIELAEADDIETHAKKYHWIQNSYAQVQQSSEDFFKQRKEELSGNFEDAVSQRVQELIKKKEQLISTYNLSQRIVQISNGIRVGVEWQDHRKGYILQNLSYKKMLLEEAARRISTAPDLLLQCSFAEVEALLEGKQIIPSLEERKKGVGIEMCAPNDEAALKNFGSEEEQELWNLYAAETTDTELNTFSGTVACAGEGKPIEGEVQIVLDPAAADDFPDGAILVAPMTSPEYVFLMKKAAAILTDTGGLTSHAAVVSRELNTPCIVNTKHATSALQNRDRVRIDPTKGVIEKL